MKAYYYERSETSEVPAGITVSKQPKLPDGDFVITEYCWGETSLWFIESDEFTADEREAARLAWSFENVEIEAQQ